MGLTRQERQNRLWNKAIALRDKADKERAFTAMLEACREAHKFIVKLSKMGILEGNSNDGLNWDIMNTLKYVIKEAEVK
jgi:hypothetical protein